MDKNGPIVTNLDSSARYFVYFEAVFGNFDKNIFIPMCHNGWKVLNVKIYFICLLKGS